MPKNLQADIDWHKARIAFYQQALEELDAAPETAETVLRQVGLRTIIADLQRTMSALEQVLGQKG